MAVMRADQTSWIDQAGLLIEREELPDLAAMAQGPGGQRAEHQFAQEQYVGTGSDVQVPTRGC